MTAGPSAVTVLVGAPASGKTTVRRQLVAGGDARAVVSLDDERLTLREQDLLGGREPRPLQGYSHRAVEACAAAARSVLAEGRGYVADSTNLRRRERVAHVRAAHAAGLPAVAVLLPHLPVHILAARDAQRPEEQRVPLTVLTRHAHRRGLLSAELLREEGFDDVIEIDGHRWAEQPAGPEPALHSRSPAGGA